MKRPATRVHEEATRSASEADGGPALDARLSEEAGAVPEGGDRAGQGSGADGLDRHGFLVTVMWELQYRGTNAGSWRP
jgi:hypothetical protein